MDFVFERLELAYPRKYKVLRVIVSLSALEQAFVEKHKLLSYVVYEYHDARDHRARSRGAKVQQAFGWLSALVTSNDQNERQANIRSNTQNAKSNQNQAFEKAQKSLTIKQLQRGFEFVGTPFEVDEFEDGIAEKLEALEARLKRSVQGTQQTINLRRGQR